MQHLKWKSKTNKCVNKSSAGLTSGHQLGAKSPSTVFSVCRQLLPSLTEAFLPPTDAI